MNSIETKRQQKIKIYSHSVSGMNCSFFGLDGQAEIQLDTYMERVRSKGKKNRTYTLCMPVTFVCIEISDEKK